MQIERRDVKRAINVAYFKNMTEQTNTEQKFLFIFTLIFKFLSRIQQTFFD